ncbi:hypothetical protein BD311DRAFT_868850 [Dichomitus squalens]|uniref:Uncharacterized protein n=1 Tax=Dichomitus squalens TaxID=114155 RepID=A0A4Q9MC40_9APHY|nr:hypothetical protein BD311DRAFT_868850 [Dichomitus squalens]
MQRVDLDPMRYPPGDPRICSAETRVQERTRAMYGYSCAICPHNPCKGILPLLRVIPDNLKGRNQLQWLSHANLPPIQGFDSSDNCVPLCRRHVLQWDQGAFILCPPIRDLLHLQEWEHRDWKERIHAREIRDRTIPPPQTLTGRLAYVWITMPYTHFDCISTLSWSCRGMGHMVCGTFPPRIYLHERASRFNTQNKTMEFHAVHDGKVGLEFQFNIPGQPWRLNPYAALVRALEVMGSAYAPVELVATDFPEIGSERSFVENPVEEYMKELLCLRSLYSRTQEDLERERRAAGAGMMTGTSAATAA